MRLANEDVTRRVSQVTEEHAEDLLAYFVRRVTPSEDAADLLSETLEILWRKAGSLPTTDEDVRPWLFGVARNVLRHYYRRETRRSAIAQRLREELAGYRPSNADTPVVLALHEALAALPEKDAEIIRLVHWEGFALREVARILRMREGTVRSRYHRSRSTLRSQLAGAERHQARALEPSAASSTP